MRIHTVELGDTIWKIARKYSTHASKIIEHNSLSAPDRLIKGQKLMIFNPTRTYTVRGGDTLDNIAYRFGVRKDMLIADNPALMGRERIYPGQILSTKFDTPIYGAGCAVGYLFSSCTEDKLYTALPYLSYVIISAAVFEYGKLRRLFNPQKELKILKESAKLPILRIYIPKANDAIEMADSFAEGITEILKKEHYGGVCLAMSGVSSLSEQTRFLMQMKRALMEEDLMLFFELDANSYPENTSEISEIADCTVLNYQKTQMSEIPSFALGEAALLERYAQEAECQKAVLDLSPFACFGCREIPISEACELAQKAGAEIEYDKDSMVCSFEYKKYRAGVAEAERIVFEAPENIKAKLELLAELGYMGISFDIARVPTEYLMIFHTSFRPCYTIGCGAKLS